jgi:uncharacterized damage-inducible protein DinB
MDRASLLDLMAFTDFAWASVEASFDSDDEALLRTAPGSGWPALRDCLAHILRGRIRWNAAIIEGKTAGMPELEEGALRTWAELNAYRAETAAPLISFMARMSEEELAAVRQFDIDGETIAYSYGDLVLHLTLHEVAHHGDISTLMYQLGMEPWVPAYRFHVLR